MPARLFDRASGKYVDVPEEKAADEIASGRHAPLQGITYPVMDANNQLYQIPGEKLQEAFAGDNGFRYATQLDVNSFQERTKAEKLKEIEEQHFGDTAGGIATAAGSLVSSAGWGLPEAVARTISPESARALDTARQVNPMWALAGDVGGMFAGPGQIAAKAGTKMTETMLAKSAANYESLANAVGRQTAEKILADQAGTVGRIAAKGAGLAVENAVLGVGQGISESSLGDPTQLAENVMAGAGWGAIIGGGLGIGGSAFSELKNAPIVKALGKGIGQATEPLRRAIAEKIVYPVISAKGERAALKAGMDTDLAARIEFEKGGSRMMSDIERESDSAAQEIDKASRQVAQELNTALKDIPKSQKTLIGGKIKEVSGDVFKAQRELLEEGGEFEKALDNTLVAYSNTPGTLMPHIGQKATATIRKLEEIGTDEAKTVARELQARFNSRYVLPHITEAGEAVQASVRDEVVAAQDIRSFMGKQTWGAEGKKLSKDVKDETFKLFKYLDDTVLKGHPEPLIREMQTTADHYWESASKLGEFLRTKPKGPIEGSIKRLMDPLAQKYFGIVMDKAPEMASVFKEYADKVKDIHGRQEILDRTLKSIAEFSQGPIGRRADPEALKAVFDAIGPTKDVLGKLDNLKRLRELQMSTAALSIPDRLMAIKSAMGHPVSKELKEISKNWESYNTLSKIRDRHMDQRLEVLPMIGKTLAGSAVGSLGAAAFGVDYKTGALVGGGAYAMMRTRHDAWRALKTLTAIQQMAETGAQKMGKTIDTAVKVMTSRTAAKALLADKAMTSIEDKRKSYKEHAKTLTELSNPEMLHQSVTERFSYLEGAPNFKAAMGTQLAKTAQFLFGKLPKDPLAQASLFHKSNYIPSDTELATFNRYVTTAENPATVVSSIAEGSVTKEQVETLRTLYPGLYEQIQQSMITELADKDLSYAHRIALGTLFDVRADASLQPGFLMRLQANFVEQDKGGRPPSKSKSPDKASAEQSEMDRVTYKS